MYRNDFKAADEAGGIGKDGEKRKTGDIVAMIIDILCGIALITAYAIIQIVWCYMIFGIDKLVDRARS